MRQAGEVLEMHILETIQLLIAWKIFEACGTGKCSMKISSLGLLYVAGFHTFQKLRAGRFMFLLLDHSGAGQDIQIIYN